MEKNITLVIIIIAAVAAILVSAINIKGFSVTESSKKFKQEYESINDKVSEKSSKKNRSVNIPENNPMEYITAEKLAKKIDNKESFVAYFGFSECPWCRSVIEELITTAQEENIRKIYYVDVKEIRDTYILNENNEPQKEKDGSKGYNSLIKKLSNVLNEYTLTTDDNKTVNVGEKRIYAPNVVAVVNGEVKILETGISTEETNPYMKLTKEMKSDSKKAFKKVFKYINK